MKITLDLELDALTPHTMAVLLATCGEDEELAVSPAMAAIYRTLVNLVGEFSAQSLIRHEVQ